VLLTARSIAIADSPQQRDDVVWVSAACFLLRSGGAKVRWSQHRGHRGLLSAELQHHFGCRLLTPQHQRQPSVTHYCDAQTLLITAMCQLSTLEARQGRGSCAGQLAERSSVVTGSAARESREDMTSVAGGADGVSSTGS
jgi:hypothetical protein